MDHIIKVMLKMVNLKVKVRLQICKIHFVMLGNGEKVYLKEMEDKILEIMYMKGSFVKEKKMGKVNFYMVMVVIMKVFFMIILFKEQVDILITTIFGKAIGKMVIYKVKVNK